MLQSISKRPVWFASRDGPARHQVEKKAYEEQQIGLQREARTKQEDAIRVAKRAEEIARTEGKIRKLNRKNEYVEHKEVTEAPGTQRRVLGLCDFVFREFQAQTL